jgi:hypothetical protein
MFRRGALFGLNDVAGNGDADHGQHYSDDQVDFPGAIGTTYPFRCSRSGRGRRSRQSRWGSTASTPRHGQGDTVHDDLERPVGVVGIGRSTAAVPAAKLTFV